MMKHCMSLLLIFALAAAISACGGKPEESAKTPTPTPTPAVTPTPAPAPPAPVPVPAAPVEATEAAATTESAVEETAEEAPQPVDALHEKLVGTSWMLSDIHVQFLDAKKVVMKGGPINALAPNGITADYSYKEGIVEVTALGQTKSGTWDGEKLVVDGRVGKRI